MVWKWQNLTRYPPMGPTSLKLARGLKGLKRAPNSLIHTGMGRSSSSESGRWGKPQGSTNSMCFTLWGGKKIQKQTSEKKHSSVLCDFTRKMPIKYTFIVLNWVLYAKYEASSIEKKMPCFVINFKRMNSGFRNVEFLVSSQQVWVEQMTSESVHWVTHVHHGDTKPTLMEPWCHKSL